MSVPHAVVVARRYPSFPWQHRNEVQLGPADHVHQALCASTAKFEDGTEETDKYGFPMIPSIRCCMLGEKRADATHVKGILRNEDHSCVYHLRAWLNHVVNTHCGHLYKDRWFPADKKRVWLQVHPRGPMIRLLVCMHLYVLQKLRIP